MTPSIKNILLPIDFSPCSLRAVVPAIELAKVSGSKLILLNVIELQSSTAPPFYFAIPPPIELEKDLHDISVSHLEELALRIRNQGVPIVETNSVMGTAYVEIVKFSKESDVDLIVMGTHGASGFNEFFIGTNAARVVNKAECPVITIKDNSELRSFGSIVIPLRNGVLGEKAFAYAIYFAKAFNAIIHLLSVQDYGSLNSRPSPAEIIYHRIQKEGIASVLKYINGSFHARQVINYASDLKAGLILVEGHLHEEYFTDYFTGPFTQQIVNHSKIPILSMRSEKSNFNTTTGKDVNQGPQVSM